MTAAVPWVRRVVLPVMAMWRRVLPLLKRAGSAFRRMLAAADALQQRHTWLAFPVAVVRKLSNDGGGSLAGLIAYYGFLAVFPLLLVFAAVLGFVLAGDSALKADVLRAAEGSFPSLQGYLSQTISGNEVALGVGLAAALWAGLGVTRATERAMNAIWDIPLADRPSLWWSRVRGLAMLCVLGTTFLFSTAVASLRGSGGALAPLTDVVAVGGSLLLNTGLYLLAFQVLTNRHLAWRQILPGALAGAIGWTALQNLGAFYVRHEVAHATQLYGSLAVVVGLLAWIYLGAQLTLYAAEINVVLAARLWPRSLGSHVRTDADRRAMIRQAQEAGRVEGEVISVSFGSTPAGAGPRPRRASATHVAVSRLAGQLAALDRSRDEADACEDPVVRGRLLQHLRAEANDAAAALAELARQEPDFGAALVRHLA